MTADILNLNDKRLQRLSPVQLTRELMRLPAKRRMEIILERADAEAVVAALDANDFFFTVQEIGPDDCLPLLGLARQDQVDHLFDLEWWRKDAVEPAKALIWLDRLGRASTPKLLEWLYHADFELLIALFKQWVTVAVAPEDIDLIEARESLPAHTLDDVYFWESRYPQYDDLIAHLLTLVYEVNYSFFKELINHVLLAPTVEIEELAYMFHKSRLMDNAIPDYYDALEIYRAIKPGEIAQKPSSLPEPGEHSPPSFALALVSDSDLLGRVLREVDNPETAEMLQFEMAALANKVIVADLLAPDSADSLRGAVEKALAHVNLGLELISGGDTEKAAETVRNVFFEHLFRLAHAEIGKIRGRLRKVTMYGWVGRCAGGVKCLDGEWFDAAEELLARTPRLLREARAGAFGPPVREDYFRTPRDLARANHLVDVITAAGYLYKALGANPQTLAPKLWSEGQVRTTADITLGVMICTAAARLLTSGKWLVEPLPASDWPAIFPLLRPAEMDRAVMDWAHGVMTDQGQRGLASEYLATVLRDYETEMRPFSEQNPPEPHLVRFFMFEEPGEG
ncbi:MAG: DUF6178 family protein [Syntrophobacteraceae bacterium]